MSVTIPWEEIKARWEKEPGHAEAYAQAKREFDAEIAIYGTIGNPKPPQATAAPRRPRPLDCEAQASRLFGSAQTSSRDGVR